MSTLPPTDWFKGWIRAHCKATAAGVEVAESLFSNAEIITGETWSATEDELHACTSRLVSRMETPRFPNEHMDAVGRELVSLRQERSRPSLPPMPADAPECPLCSNMGQVVVIHPGCVWRGRVVKHRDSGRVLTCAVYCDQCAIGRRLITMNRTKDQNQWGLTLDSYFKRIGGLDGVGLLKEYEGELAWIGRGKVNDEQRRREFAVMYPRIAAMVSDPP